MIMGGRDTATHRDERQRELKRTQYDDDAERVACYISTDSEAVPIQRTGSIWFL